MKRCLQRKSAGSNGSFPCNKGISLILTLHFCVEKVSQVLEYLDFSISDLTLLKIRKKNKGNINRDYEQNNNQNAYANAL